MRRPVKWSRWAPALGLSLLFGVALTATPIGVAVAGAAPVLSCGETITSSMTLRANLTCGNYDGTALTIDATGVTVNLGGHTITGRSGYDALYLEGSRITLQGGTIRDFRYGIFANDLEGDTLTGLTIETGSTTGIYVTTTAVGTTVSFDHFSDLYHGVRAVRAGESTIADNTFRYMYDAISVRDYAYALTIRGNLMSTLTTGLYLSAAFTGTVVETNRITGGPYPHGTDGVYVEFGFGVSVTTNQVRGFRDGIDVRSSGTVANNVTDTNYVGIFAGFDVEATLTHDTADGNVNGIQLTDTYDAQVEGCTLSYNDDGIYIFNEAFRPGASVTRTTAAHNRSWGFYAVNPVTGSRNVTRDNGQPSHNVPL